METITDLANAGLAGVALFAIGSLVIVVNKVLKLIGNHMAHNTESNEKLAGRIESLIDFVERRIK